MTKTNFEDNCNTICLLIHVRVYKNWLPRYSQVSNEVVQQIGLFNHKRWLETCNLGFYSKSTLNISVHFFSVHLLPKSVANFCDCTDQFVYDLMGTPRIEVSHDAAQINNDRLQFGY